MSNIYTGNSLRIFYNTDIANRQLQNTYNKEITNLAAYPDIRTTLGVTSIETYDSNFVSAQVGNTKLNPFSVVVHYVPTDLAHQYLDNSTEVQREMQIIIRMIDDSSADGNIFYMIFNGYFSKSTISGDQNATVKKSYTFNPTELVASGTTQNTPMVVGNFGLGSDGNLVPQYTPTIPEGNSFTKIPANSNDSPAQGDYIGISTIDDHKVNRLVMSEDGELNIYARNSTSGWKKLLTTEQIDDRYLNTADNLNDLQDKAVARTNLDVYSKGESDARNALVSNNLSDLKDKAAARTNIDVFSKGESTANFAARSANLSDLGDAAAARTNIDVYSKGESDSRHALVSNNLIDLTDKAAARTNIGLGNVATYNIGTSGDTIPLLSGNNTWSNEQHFSNISTFGRNASANVMLEIGSMHTALPAHIDFHSSGTGTDYDSRILAIGGDTTDGQGALEFTASTASFTNDVSVKGQISSVRDIRSNSSGYFDVSVNSPTINTTTINGTTLNILNINSTGDLRIGNVYADYTSSTSLLAHNATFTSGPGNPLTISSGAPCLRFEETETGKQYWMVADGYDFRIQPDHTGSTTNVLSYVASTDTTQLPNATAASLSLANPLPLSSGGLGTTDINQARITFNVQNFKSDAHDTIISSPTDPLKYIYINSAGVWGAYDGNNGKSIALGVGVGGTGADNAEDARTNLGVYSKEEAPNKDEVFLKKDNLSGIADRAAAWLNVRPQGSTPLGGDPVDDYDAATKRWVENKISTGTVGPTLNGVMNYGVGSFRLHDGRAYMQPFEVPSDGQLLNRADWPELWAYAQLFGPIDDATWVNDIHQRGKYSTGNGSTTFRVPDRNGVQLNSITSLYGRGDGTGNGTSGAEGQVFEDGVPNITGAIAAYSGSSYAQFFGDITGGAFFANNGFFPQAGGDAIPDTGAISLPGRYNTANFDASRVNDVYGRGYNEVMGRNFVGVWVIRASGGFTAANTSWAVINGDSTRPVDGTIAYGGFVKSQYNTGTKIEAEGGMQIKTTIGGQYATMMTVRNNTSGNFTTADLLEDGTFYSNSFRARNPQLMGWSESGFRNGSFGTEYVNVGSNYGFNSALSYRQASSAGYQTTTHFGQIHNDLGSFADSCWHVAGDDSNQYGVRMKIQPNSTDIFFYFWQPNNSSQVYTLQKNAVSDASLKHDIKDIDATKSTEVLKGIEFKSFIYNADEQNRVRRGVIAQQLETIEPLYVKNRTYFDMNGNEQTHKELDTHPMLFDTMIVVQDLMKKVEVQNETIASQADTIAAQQSQIDELVAVVKALIDKQ